MTERTRWGRPALWALVVVVVWLVVGGAAGSFQGRLADVQENDAETYLPADAEATRAGQLSARFGEDGVVPAVVVYERDGGLTPDDWAYVETTTSRLTGLPGLARPPSDPMPAPDQAAVSQSLAVVEDQLSDTVAEVRDVIRDGAPPGLLIHVTGPAGFVADLGEAFGEIDGLLLVVTASVVAVILVLVYRSPLLPLLVLIGAGLALGTASAVVYGLTHAGFLVLNGQSQGIMLILVFGAATDYALLLVARYREELAARHDRFAAMAVAWRRSAGPIIASGSTVILAVLALLLSELELEPEPGPGGGRRYRRRPSGDADLPARGARPAGPGLVLAVRAARGWGRTPARLVVEAGGDRGPPGTAGVGGDRPRFGGVGRADAAAARRRGAPVGLLPGRGGVGGGAGGARPTLPRRQRLTHGDHHKRGTGEAVAAAASSVTVWRRSSPPVRSMVSRK